MSARATHGLIGRAEVEGQVREYLLVPSAHEVALLLLSGEEGIGKSLALKAAVAEAREHGFLVLEGRAQAVEIPQPLSLLQEIFSSLVLQRKKAAGTNEGVKSLAELGLARQGERRGGGMVPMGLLGLGLSEESPEEREARLLTALSRRESDREEEEQEIFDRMADHMEETADEHKMLIAIDDLHNADQASLDFLGYLARRSRGRKIKMIATTRPDADLPDRVRALLTDLGQEKLVNRLEVRRFDEKESREFLHHLARGRELPASMVQEWISVSHGNPLALEQLFRISRSTPTQAGQGTLSPAAALMASLSEEERRGLSHAAVLGKVFGFQLLFQTVGGSEERLAEVVDGLIRKGTLRETGEETYQFSGDDLWNEVYRSMTDRRKRILHKKAAIALETLKPGDPGVVYELARHYFLAREFGKAFEFNKQAATLAKSIGDAESAAVYFDQALQSLRGQEEHDRKEEEAIMVDFALCLDVIGEVDRAIRMLQEVATSPLVALHLAKLNTHAGRWKEAEAIVRGTLGQLDGSEDPAIAGMAYRMLGGMSTYRGRFDESLQNFSRAITLLVRAGLNAEAARARLLMADAKRYLAQVDAKEIESDYLRGIQELRSLGDLSLLAPAIMNYGLWLIEAGRIDESIKTILESLEVAERAHNARMAGWAHFNLADVLLAQGRVEEAAGHNAKSREKLERASDKFGLIQVHLVQAKIFERQKKLDLAEIEILDAFRLASEVGFETDQLEVLFRQGEFLLLKGDRQGARKRLDEIEAGHFEKMRPDLKAEIQRFREAVRG